MSPPVGVTEIQLIPRESNYRGIVNMSGNNCRSQHKGLITLSLGVFSTTYKQAFMWSEQMLHERQILSPGSLFQEGNGFENHPVQNPLLGKTSYTVCGWQPEEELAADTNSSRYRNWLPGYCKHRHINLNQFLFTDRTHILYFITHTPSWVFCFWFSAHDCFIFWFVLSWPLATLMITELFTWINWLAEGQPTERRYHICCADTGFTSL